MYVYARDAAGEWSQHAYVKASNAEALDTFGIPIGISGSTLAVAARNERSASTGVNTEQSDNSAYNAGAVYVFR